jgi:hypothetical protein
MYRGSYSDSNVCVVQTVHARSLPTAMSEGHVSDVAVTGATTATESAPVQSSAGGAAESCRHQPPVAASKPKGASKWFWGKVLLVYNDAEVRKANKQPDCFCVVCGTEIKYYGSTGNAERHANKHSALKPGEDRKGPMDAHRVAAPGFRDSVVRWIVQTYQPLSAVEHESFKSMIYSASFKAQVPSREEVVKSLDELEALARSGVEEALQAQDVALTSDAWTSASQDPYLSLTGTMNIIAYA